MSSLEGHNTVWPEILAGIYFGGLLKFLYLVEFTLAVWQSQCHNDIRSKMANPGEKSTLLESLSEEYTCAVV